jgi:hypothetical protein
LLPNPHISISMIYYIHSSDDTKFQYLSTQHPNILSDEMHYRRFTAAFFGNKFTKVCEVP